MIKPMINKPNSEDDLVDQAIADIESLPITVSNQAAIFLAAAAVTDGVTVFGVISKVLEEWGHKQQLAHLSISAALAKAPHQDAAESARRMAARRAMTPSLRLAALQRDKHCCVSCGATAPAAKLHVDHIIAVANGGETVLANLQALCEDCNLGKAAKVINLPDANSRSQRK